MNLQISEDLFMLPLAHLLREISCTQWVVSGICHSNFVAEFMLDCIYFGCIRQRSWWHLDINRPHPSFGHPLLVIFRVVGGGGRDKRSSRKSKKCEQLWKNSAQIVRRKLNKWWEKDTLRRTAVDERNWALSLHTDGLVGLLSWPSSMLCFWISATQTYASRVRFVVVYGEWFMLPQKNSHWLWYQMFNCMACRLFSLEVPCKLPKAWRDEGWIRLNSVEK